MKSLLRSNGLDATDHELLLRLTRVGMPLRLEELAADPAIEESVADLALRMARLIAGGYVRQQFTLTVAGATAIQSVRTNGKTAES